MKKIMSIFATHFVSLPFIKIKIMKTDISKQWENYGPEDFCEAILKRNCDSSSVAYYLINKRLRNNLKTVFLNLGCGDLLEFQDTIEDFFLYLHDGDGWKFNEPFHVLEGIENKGALFKWIMITYRNFLVRSMKVEIKKKTLTSEGDEEPSMIHDEDKIRFLSTAIAYADQSSVSRSRFVLYRLLLTFLNKSLAVSQAEMAEAVDMQPVAYRVSTKRTKDNLLSYIKFMESGGDFELDSEHEKMRDTIIFNFDRLYPTLSEYYEKAICKLPKANEIRRLRFSSSNGHVLHEEMQPYGLCNCHDVGRVYMCIKMFCANDNAV